MTIKCIGRITTLLFLSCFLSLAVVHGQTVEELIADGDSLYLLNDYDGSISAFRQACEADSSNFESFWKLGRSLNLKGEIAIRDSQLTIFEEASEIEKYALLLNEDNADAHFQLARALGKIALFKGIFKSASLAKQVRKECQRALAIDSLHDGAWHILGRWHREVGKKPKILRLPMGLGAANKKDAFAFMEKALEINPGNINHHLEMGHTYRKFKKYDLAKSEYEKCLEITPNGPLDNKYQEEAKKNLAEMD